MTTRRLSTDEAALVIQRRVKKRIQKGKAPKSRSATFAQGKVERKAPGQAQGGGSSTISSALSSEIGDLVSRLRDRCTAESQRADRLEGDVAELVRARERSLVDRETEKRVFEEQREPPTREVSLVPTSDQTVRR